MIIIIMTIKPFIKEKGKKQCHMPMRLRKIWYLKAKATH